MNSSILLAQMHTRHKRFFETKLYFLPTLSCYHGVAKCAQVDQRLILLKTTTEEEAARCFCCCCPLSSLLSPPSATRPSDTAKAPRGITTCTQSLSSHLPRRQTCPEPELSAEPYIVKTDKELNRLARSGSKLRGEIGEPIMRGWMQKKGGNNDVTSQGVIVKERTLAKGGRRNWNTRWCVLLPNGVFLVYETDEETSPNLTASVSLSTEAGLYVHAAHGYHAGQFLVKAPKTWTNSDRKSKPILMRETYLSLVQPLFRTIGVRLDRALFGIDDGPAAVRRRLRLRCV